MQKSWKIGISDLPGRSQCQWIIFNLDFTKWTYFPWTPMQYQKQSMLQLKSQTVRKFCLTVLGYKISCVDWFFVTCCAFSLSTCCLQLTSIVWICLCFPPFVTSFGNSCRCFSSSPKKEPRLNISCGWNDSVFYCLGTQSAAGVCSDEGEGQDVHAEPSHVGCTGRTISRGRCRTYSHLTTYMLWRSCSSFCGWE